MSKRKKEYFNLDCLPVELTAAIMNRGLEMQSANRGMPVPVWKVKDMFESEISDGRLIRTVKFVGHLKAEGFRVFDGRKWQFVDFRKGRGESDIGRG